MSRGKPLPRAPQTPLDPTPQVEGLAWALGKAAGLGALGTLAQCLQPMDPGQQAALVSRLLLSHCQSLGPFRLYFGPGGRGKESKERSCCPGQGGGGGVETPSPASRESSKAQWLGR